MRCPKSKFLIRIIVFDKHEHVIRGLSLSTASLVFVGYDYVPDDILSVDDLRDVKDNPGDVAAKEHKHDADDDGREVDLFLHRLSLAAVGVPGKNFTQ